MSRQWHFENISFRWEDAKGAYLKFINKLIMGHIEIFSYTNTHIHPLITIIHYNYSYINTKIHHDTCIQLFTRMY